MTLDIEARELTPEDFELGELIWKSELINPLVPENMFSKSIYWILSAGERHDKQLRIYSALEKAGLLDPDSVLEKRNSRKLHNIIKTSRWPNNKEDYIKGFAEYWCGSDISKVILNDALNGHEDGYNIRRRLDKEAPGMEYKCASGLLMSCGYEYLVMIDKNLLKFFKTIDNSVQVSDYRTNSGPNGGLYLAYEGYVCNQAEKRYNCCGALLQATIWAKLSPHSYMYLQEI